MSNLKYPNEEFVLNEIKKLNIHPNRFSREKMEKDGLGGLASGVDKWGGFPHFRKLLGFSVPKNTGYFKDQALSKEEIEQKIIEEIKANIKNPEDFDYHSIRKLGFKDLSNTISHNGGFPYYREKLGWIFDDPYESIEGINNLLKECNITEDEFRYTKLVEKGLNKLADAITLVGRKFNKNKKLNSYDYFRSLNGWEILGNKKYPTLRSLISAIDLMGIQEEDFVANGLTALGHSDIKNASNRFGYNVIRKAKGWKEIIRYDNKETVADVIKQNIAPENFNCKYLLSHGFKRLYKAIKKHGDFSYYDALFGWQEIRLEEEKKILEEKQRQNKEKQCKKEKKEKSKLKRKQRKRYATVEDLINDINDKFPDCVVGYLPSPTALRNSGIHYYKYFDYKEICKASNRKPMIGYLTRSGNIVDSKFELLVDEYFYSRGLNGYYRYDEPIELKGKKRNMRCDFFFPNIKLYIELWGYPYSENVSKKFTKIVNEYNKKRIIKEKFYKDKTFIGIDFNVIKDKNISQIEKELDIIFVDFFNAFNIELKKRYDYDQSIWLSCINENYLIEEILKINQKCLEEFGRPLNKKDFKGAGKIKLRNMIKEYYGDLNILKKELNIPIQVKTSKELKETYIEEYKLKMIELGRHPKKSELPSSVVHAIQRIEKMSLTEYRKKYPEYPEPRSDHDWYFDELVVEFQKIYEQIDKLPNHSDLVKLNKSNLYEATKNYCKKNNIKEPPMQYFNKIILTTTRN